VGIRNLDGKGPSVPLQLPRGSLGAGGLCFSPDGKVVCTTIGTLDDGGTALWNTSTGKQIGKVMKQPGARWAVFSPDSTALATGDDKGNVLLWDAATGASRGEPVAPNSFSDLRPHQGSQFRFSPDSTKLLHVTPNGVLRIRDALTGKVLTESQLNDPIFRGLSPDGKRALLSNKNGYWLWDVEHGEAVARVVMPKGVLPYYAVFSPNGRTMAVAFDIEPPNPVVGWLLWKVGKGDK
jgi:WD40 repeat protein